jgi:FixJ family two-component response regulator
MPGYNKIGSAKTILLVDGEQRLRQSLSRSLRTSGYHLMVASDGEEAIKISLEFKEAIHLLLANVEMPDMTGIELAQRITRMRPDTKVSLLLGLDSGVLVLDHGWQFLPAPFAADLLRTRILEILKESQSTAKRDSLPEDGLSGYRSLTKREIQVMKLVAGGNSTKQVAAILGIAFKTSVGHRSHLMQKLNIHDSATLARAAVRVGLVEP